AAAALVEDRTDTAAQIEQECRAKMLVLEHRRLKGTRRASSIVLILKPVGQNARLVAAIGILGIAGGCADHSGGLVASQLCQWVLSPEAGGWDDKRLDRHFGHGSPVAGESGL